MSNLLRRVAASPDVKRAVVCLAVAVVSAVARRI